MDNLKFITNNCNGLATSDVKRLKMFLYLQNTVKNGVVFLQETHSNSASENKFRNDFGKNNELYFSHGTSASCGVAIGFCGSYERQVKKEISDPNGRYLMMHVKVGDSDYALINIYNPNTENEQVRLLAEIGEKMEQLEIEPDTNVVFGGDFNFYFDKTLEADGGNPRTKLQSIANFIKIKEKYDLCDIWRIHHPTMKRYTFRQNRNTGKLQTRLDYLFISNHLQTSACKSDIKVAMCTDHSPVFLDLSLENIHLQKGPGFWKYNSSLNKDPVYKDNLRALIRDFLQENHNLNGQVKWELLKWEVKKYTISYTSKLAKEKRAN